MSNEPQRTRYFPKRTRYFCSSPHCEGAMATWNGTEFSFSKLCRSCELRSHTRVRVAFCFHGHPVTHRKMFYPLTGEPPALACGCNDKDLSRASWSWVLKR